MHSDEAQGPKGKLQEGHGDGRYDLYDEKKRMTQKTVTTKRVNEETKLKEERDNQLKTVKKSYRTQKDTEE